MNHCTCLVVGALCMFKWLNVSHSSIVRVETLVVIIFSLELQWTRSTVRILLQPCTKLLTFADMWDSQHLGPPGMHLITL